MAVSGSPAGRTYVTEEAWDTASLARRAGAWILDMTLLLFVVLVVAAMFGLTASRQIILVAQDGSTSTTTVDYVPAQWYGALLALGSAIYSIPFWQLKRATLGQRVLNLLVVDLEIPNPISWRQAAIRWLVLFGWTFASIGSSIPLLAWVFGAVFVAWFAVLIATTWRDARGQGIHDRFAGTLVVKRNWYQVVSPQAAAGSGTPPAQGPSAAPANLSTGASRGPRRSTRRRPAKD